MKQLILLVLEIYKATRILRVPSCRFYPPCSDYCSESIVRFGLWQGLVHTWNRLLRCHPFHAGGWDPVPSAMSGDKNVVSGESA